MDSAVLVETVLNRTELDMIILNKTILHGQSSTVQNSNGENILYNKYRTESFRVKQYWSERY